MLQDRALAEILVKNSVDGMCAVDREYRHVLWNRAMEAFAGMKAEEVLGRNAFEVFPFLRDLGFDRVLERVLAGEAMMTEATPNDSPEGRRYYDRHFSPLRDDAGEIVGVLIIVRDVTDRRRAEEALRASEERLRASQKLEAVGRLAGGVAHDFNNLLTVILTCAERLAASSAHGPSSELLAAEIAQAAQRGASLTQQLLTFSRAQPTTPRTLVLDATVADVEAMLRRLIGDHIELETRLEAGQQGRVRLGAGQIEQLIVNLVLNARDALGERGGRIRIATSLGPLAGAGATPGGLVTLRVEDDGCGMSDEVKAHLFEPFFTTKARGRGTGLGLATVYGIVRQNGGHVEVRSEVDRGTTFDVLLPVAPVEEPPVSSREPVAATPRGHESIVLVEDEAPLRRMIAAMLVEAGYRVVEAHGPEEALRACDERTDLLISDIAMPGMNGRELAARVRHACPNVRVLLMSGYDDTGPGDGEPVLGKPFTGAMLTQRVRELLDGPR